MARTIGSIELTDSEVAEIEDALADIDEYPNVRNTAVVTDSVTVKFDRDNDSYGRIIPHDERGDVTVYLDDKFNVGPSNHVDAVTDVVDGVLSSYERDEFEVFNTDNEGASEHNVAVAYLGNESWSDEPLTTLMGNFELAYVNPAYESPNTYDDFDGDGAAVTFFFNVGE